jgi:hypothetical protein
LQRRRRQSTQIIKKKNLSASTVYSYPNKQSSGFNWKRFFSWSIIIIALLSVSYYFYFELPDPAGKEIIADDTDMNPQEETVIEEPQITETSSAPFEDNIQVEVLNGCGFNGVAKTFQSYLRENGFDVVNTDNYIEDGKKRWDISKSMVIDRIGKIEQAMAVARVLDIPSSRVFSRENGDSIYDVSVVIGKDFKSLSGSN